jgi:hypothetical protein
MAATAAGSSAMTLRRYTILIVDGTQALYTMKAAPETRGVDALGVFIPKLRCADDIAVLGDCPEQEVDRILSWCRAWGMEVGAGAV